MKNKPLHVFHVWFVERKRTHGIMTYIHEFTITCYSEEFVKKSLAKKFEIDTWEDLHGRNRERICITDLGELE